VNPRLEKLRARIDDLSIRERGWLFITLAVLLGAAWQWLLMDPVERQQKDLVEKITAAQKQVTDLNDATQALVSARTADPDAENRRALEELRAALAGFDTQIKGTVSGLVEPRQMAQMLEEVLARNPGLVLKKARSLPAKPLVAAEEGSTSTVYQHGLRLELEGSYLDALAYLRALQKMPRSIYWDEVRVSMDKYPKAEITITVHTLSLSEGWIGV
jgi:MSHA biogenesis protein MshJ